MNCIRVLIVDDSAVMRRLLGDALSADPELQVVGAAIHGKQALEKIDQLQPHVVTLDVEMPVMDGLETLRVLRRRAPRLPVIMFSTLTERGAAATINALASGANDYVTKPANIGGVTESLTAIRNQLIPRIKALCRRDAPAAPQNFTLRAPKTPTPRRPIEVVVIGTSTGGPNALAEVLRRLPADFPVPLLVVQHMPPVFTRYLAERLDAICPLQVREAAGGERLDRGHIWIAPGDYHMEIQENRDGVFLLLHQRPPENSCRPSVDPLFRSAAQVFRQGTLGLILTGMGQDGLNGSRAVVEAGGSILVQDEATSVVWGMPGAVAKAGLADQVLPLDRFADEVVQRVLLSHRFRQVSSSVRV